MTNYLLKSNLNTITAKLILTTLLIVFISGCTTSARNTPASQTDYSKYQSYDCDALLSEAENLAQRGTALARAVDRERMNDMVLIGSFGILSLPAVNVDQTTPENIALADVKGDMQSLTATSIKKDCPISFQSNESESYKVDNSSNPVLDLKPIDQSVVYTVIKHY